MFKRIDHFTPNHDRLFIEQLNSCKTFEDHIQMAETYGGLGKLSKDQMQPITAGLSALLEEAWEEGEYGWAESDRISKKSLSKRS